MIRKAADTFVEDRVSVYAAQATFFVIISVVPFVSLLVSIAGIILPNINLTEMLNTNIPEGTSEIVMTIIKDITSANSISLLSISAVITLWTASRGITAVRDGIGSVYRARPGKNYLSHRLISLGFTLLFIIFTLLLVMLVLFGDALITRFGGDFSGIILKLRVPFFMTVLSLFFTLLYSFVAQRSDHVEHNAVYHLPGGIFSSVGWLVFSYFYSLYISNYSSASVIYGGLTALCLIMLWLYFCMLILLAGSEINKMFFAVRKTGGGEKKE